MRTNSGAIRIGIGGWVYPPWRGAFYPAGLRQAEELAHASRQVTAIEINGTFYRTQTPASFRKWHDETPAGFVFSLKGPRYVTQRADLAGAASGLERFFASGLSELGDKLGPILWQLAPFKRFDAADVAAFLRLLPKGFRHVLEVRHPSFATPEFFDLARAHEVAIALVDDAKYPKIDEATAGFAYLRLRRCAETEPSGYPPAAFDEWAARLRQWSAAGRDCFLYFIDGAKVRAPAAAQALLARLG